ncbi:MAG: hypothetical protein DSO07_06445 [Thermoproteota archaeon]|jgi:uncharacterized membrane protein|uniref:Uncharacterized protein n=2 Tax=Candidatus Methanodesulfokora washburnensis TaxID=2478471 RepID=A0A429GDQ9_9CREN|nr:hypothetical protein [Candidatus Methanodesulfokores washburnensis]RSN71906.1 hypothetical protein D6D85_15075 [Candidatus Methanodesulfokores washburnensis]TDA41070.1 MAG: hypothetical protein DSO07_06445 [Candidatus Korarchaeota archaeon]
MDGDVMRRKGVSGTVEQALLLILTIALFLSIIAAPIMNVVSIFEQAPSKLWNGTVSAVKWLDETVAKIFGING